eukprot:7406996-Pyramimonas_sp.AAC.1
MRVEPHVNVTIGAFVRVPYGATNCLRGTKSEVELHANFPIGGALLWGHEPCEGCAEMGGGIARKLSFWLSFYGATQRAKG